MTALERIKEIEKDLHVRCGCLDGPLLLKAFHAMRKVAIAERRYNWQVDTREEVMAAIDQEFEKKMSK